MDAIVESTVVPPIFGEEPRVKQRMIEAGIKHCALIVGRSIDGNQSEFLVPNLF